MKKNILIIDSLTKDQTVTVGEHENKIIFILVTDGYNQDGHVKVSMKGKNSSAKILGVVIGTNNQVINLHTFQDHVMGESVSDLLIKSVLFDESKFNYDGVIRIEKNAQKSNAYQKNQNLLLSKSSWANSKPGLEILANDVRCTHGATVGQINDDQLYYLKTRGLHDDAAKRILVEGFINDVLEKIEDEDMISELKEKVDKILSTKLN
jgi:Fe-S cluster assembly protein SufD